MILFLSFSLFHSHYHYPILYLLPKLLQGHPNWSPSLWCLISKLPFKAMRLIFQEYNSKDFIPLLKNNLPRHSTAHGTKTKFLYSAFKSGIIWPQWSTNLSLHSLLSTRRPAHMPMFSSLLSFFFFPCCSLCLETPPCHHTWMSKLYPVFTVQLKCLSNPPSQKLKFSLIHSNE